MRIGHHRSKWMRLESMVGSRSCCLMVGVAHGLHRQTRHWQHEQWPILYLHRQRPICTIIIQVVGAIEGGRGVVGSPCSLLHSHPLAFISYSNLFFVPLYHSSIDNEPRHNCELAAPHLIWSFFPMIRQKAL